MATLTKAMLEDLHMGNASLSILPYTKGGVSLATLDFSGADQLFTLQDSLQISPSDPETNAIKIDQNNETIDFSFEEGDWTITGNIPSTAKALLSYFFEEGNSAAITGQDGAAYSGQAYDTSKEVELSILVESQSKKTAIALARVKMAVNPPSVENRTTPAYVKFTGYVLVNPSGDRFAVLSAASA